MCIEDLNVMGYIITRVMMDNWCMITIFDLALS